MKLRMRGREKHLSKSNTNAIAAHRHSDLTGWAGLSPDATVLSVEGRDDKSALSASGLRKEERMKNTVSKFEQREARWSICSSHLTNFDCPSIRCYIKFDDTGKIPDGIK
jgi:hypothetical protein